MEYKIIGTNNYKNPLYTFLENRNVKNVDGYINIDNSVVIPYYNLTNMDMAVETYKYHIENDNNICILVDPDVDGYTSATMIYSYTKNLNPKCKLTYLLHTGKGHGLTEEIESPEDTQLLIIPDAGTNDTVQCKALKEKGIDIVILDHHDAEVENPYAIIVNNQCSKEYGNKELCGAGVVYKFLQAVDQEMWNDCADDYLDLVALANISDCMDMRSIETKYLVSEGIKYVVNSFFEKLIEAQSYYFPDGLTIIGIQFYITPYLNALIRLGTQEEKEIIFRAFIGDESETFQYKKRGESTFTKESIYERAVRFCKNAKSKQKRIVDKQLPIIVEHIKQKNQDSNEVIVTNVTDYIESTMTGVLAIKVAEIFHKPCMLLRERCDNEFGGSIRVPDCSPIINFKDIVNDTGVFKAQGHEGACGVTVNKGDIKTGLKILNEYIIANNLSEVTNTLVDFEIDYNEFNIGMFNDIASLKPYYGQKLKECNVLIRNISVVPKDTLVRGADSNTWCTKICDESIELIKFKGNENDEILSYAREVKKLMDEESPIPQQLSEPIFINVIGKFGYSHYNGIKTAQIIIEDYEVI